MKEKALDRKLIQKAKKIEIYARKKITDTFLADYKSVFRGQGMSFRDFREYAPGDDVRHIAWPLSARTGKTYIKTFEEDREQNLLFAVDISGSHFFGTQNKLKFDTLCELVALMSFSAVSHRNSVGLCLFSDKVEHFVPPRKSTTQVQRLLVDLYSHQGSYKKTSLKSALEHLRKYLKKKTYIIICSDFIDENFEKDLKILNAKHEVLAIFIEDKGEIQLPRLGLIEFQDQETKKIHVVDTNSASFRRDYEAIYLKKRAQTLDILKKSQTEVLKASSQEDTFKTLSRFFQKKRSLR